VRKHGDIWQRLPDVRFDGFEQLMPVLDGPLAGDKHMEGYKLAGARLPGAKRVVLHAVLHVFVEDALQFVLFL
jgi:hypothetical protein